MSNITYNKIFVVEDNDNLLQNTATAIKEVNGQYEIHPRDYHQNVKNFNFHAIRLKDSEENKSSEDQLKDRTDAIVDKIVKAAPHIIIFDYLLDKFQSSLTAPRLMKELYDKHLDFLKNVYLVFHTAQPSHTNDYSPKFKQDYPDLKDQFEISNKDLNFKLILDTANNWLNSNLGMEVKCQNFKVNYTRDNLYYPKKIILNNIVLIKSGFPTTNLNIENSNIRGKRATIFLHDGSILIVNVQKFSKIGLIVSANRNLKMHKKSTIYNPCYFKKTSDGFSLENGELIEKYTSKGIAGTALIMA